ncbi:MAG: TonB-dependent receptor [Myxococcota bacterium]
MISATAALLILLTTGESPEDETKTKVYPRSFFDAFNPQTARDLVDQVPGFTLDRGSPNRGFSTSAGNVLIDDQRPSSKLGGIDEALARIPASSVDRVEVIRGTAASSEALGQTSVVNVVRTHGGVAGSWSAMFEHPADHDVYPEATIAVTYGLGDWRASTQTTGFSGQLPRYGFRESRDADRQLTLTQTEEDTVGFEELSTATEARGPFATGILTVNGRVGRAFFDTEVVRRRFNGSADDATARGLQTVTQSTRYYEGELGIDWQRAVNSWKVKLLSFNSMSHVLSRQNTALDDFATGSNESSRFRQEDRNAESVLRLTAAKPDSMLQPQLGLEVGYTRVESDVSLITQLDSEAPTPAELAGDDVVVRELRVDAFANSAWQATESSTIEGGLGLEASNLAVRGDTRRDGTFVFIKPSLAWVYRPSAGAQFRAGVARTISQLSFEDFRASAESLDDRVLGGNPEISPERSTRVTLSGDLRETNWGAAALSLFGERRAMALEQTVLPSGTAGTANVGTAWLAGAEADLTVAPARLAPGATLKASLTLQASSITDPLTDRRRPVSGVAARLFEIAFRYDLPEMRVSWGGSITSARSATTYYADERSDETNGGVWRAFAEGTWLWGTKLQLAVRNIGDRSFERNRVFFAPDRSGAQTGTERIVQMRPWIGTLTLSGQF